MVAEGERCAPVNVNEVILKDGDSDARGTQPNLIKWSTRQRSRTMVQQQYISHAGQKIERRVTPRSYCQRSPSAHFESPKVGMTPAGTAPEVGHLIEKIEKIFFEVLDSDNSGSISFREFGAAVEQLHPDINMKEKHKLFDFIDADGSGQLTFDEIAQLVAGTCVRHPQTTDPQTLLRCALGDAMHNRQRHGKIDTKTNKVLDELERVVLSSVVHLKECVRIHKNVQKTTLRSMAAKYEDELGFVMNFVPRMGSQEQRAQLERIQAGIGNEEEMIQIVQDTLTREIIELKNDVDALKKKNEFQRLQWENEELKIKAVPAIQCKIGCSIM